MKKDLDIVVTMGGLGSRFRKAGYNKPKYMIDAKGKTLFDWSMLSLKNLFGYAEHVIFLVMEDSRYDVKKFINDRCRVNNINNYQVILLNHLTDGQATTALLAQKYWRKENKLLIYNIDTYVDPKEMLYSDFCGDGFIPCFSAPGDHWSFVRLDEKGKVVEIKEKIRISDHCTIGAYYFSSCDLYERLYYEYYTEQQHIVEGERYVAPLYDYLISLFGEIFIKDIPAESVHVLGTPEELTAFLNDGLSSGENTSS